MRNVNRSALVPFSALQMYGLVEQVLDYPKFLPWCVGATIHSRNERFMEASLSIQRSGVIKSFRTRNSLWPDERMMIELVDGPFQHLEGNWYFEQLGEEGSKVILRLDFEFESKVVDAMFGRYLEDSCNSLIESFTERAQHVYG